MLDHMGSGKRVLCVLCMMYTCGSPGLYIIITTDEAIPENITSLLPSVLLRVRNMSDNANGNKGVIFFVV